MKKVYQYYEEFRGKKITEKSKPTFDEGFYKCSTTKNSKVQLLSDLKLIIKKINHNLKKMCYNHSYNLHISEVNTATYYF